MALSQTWFWSASWQAGEQEAEEQLRRGEGEVFTTADDFFRALDKN